MSSAKQVAEHIVALLRAATWSGGSQERVFGDAVFVSMRQATDADAHLSWPWALVTLGQSQVDEDEPTLSLQRFTVEVFTRNAQGWIGDSVLVGANNSDVGSSRGKGLLDLEEPLFDLLAYIGADVGLKPGLRFAGGSPIEEFIDMAFGAARKFEFEAIVTASPTYPPAAFFHGVAGSGSATLRWAEPPDRSDYTGLVLRRASGSTPPATATDGTGVAISPHAESVNNSPGAGTWSYALFAEYGSTYSTGRTWTGSL